MAFTIKQYSGDAQPTTLATGIGAADASFVAVNGANYPDGSVGPFVIDLNLNNTFTGGGTEEKILCSARSGNVFTVAVSGRGYDGTTASSHVAGEPLNHTISAVDMTEANAAVVNTIGKVTSLGDMIVASGANAFARLPIGSANQVLTATGGTAAWAAPGAASTILGAVNIPNQTITSSVFADFPSGAIALTFNVPASGKVKFTMNVSAMSTAASDGIGLSIVATAGANTGSTSSGTLGIVAGPVSNPFLFGPASGSANGGNTIIFYISSLAAGSTTFTLRAEKLATNSVPTNGVFMAEVG